MVEKKTNYKQRVLIFTNHFYPENFKINDIAFHLAKENCEVTVVTGLPNYPTRDKYKKDYGYFKRRKEIVNDVKVIRLPLITRGKGNKLRLTINYLSFSIVSILYAFYIGFSKKFDIVFVHHTSPIFIGIPAIIVKKIQGIKLYFWNLDLWPEAFCTAVKFKSKIIENIILILTTWIQKQADVMLIASKGYKSIMLKRGVTEDKIVYFPNWAEEMFFQEPPTQKLPFKMPEGFNVVFAGNLGDAQDLPNVLKAVEILKNENINWVFVGNGRGREKFEQQVKQANLSHKVFLPGRYPMKYMPTLYKKADLLLVSLVDEPIFTLPAKVQTYMTSGTPIVGMLNGEGSELINEVRCGIGCAAGDYQCLAQNVLALSKLPKDYLERLGQNGYDYCREHFYPKDKLNFLTLLLKGEVAKKAQLVH